MLTTKDLKDLFGENSPDRVILKAQKLSAKGRNDQAIAVIKDGIARLGELPELRIEMATLWLSSTRPKEAAECLRALLKADPSQVGRVDEFIGWARMQFSDIEALYEPMAEGHLARRNFNAAVECLERINRKSLETMLEGRLVNLNRFLEKGTLVPKSALSTLYLAALSYEAIDDWQKAIESYRRILTAAPADFTMVDERLKGLVARHYKHTQLRLIYADLLASLGHRDRAQAEYLKALEVDVRSAPQVSRYLAELLSAAPDDQDLLWAQVKVLLAEAKIDEAVAVCSRLAEQKSHLPEIEKLLEEASATGKETVETQLLLAKVALAQGKVQRAVAATVAALGNDAGPRGIAALEQAIEMFPNETRAYQILADFHLKEGRVDKCLDTYRALRRVDPATGAAIATRLQSVLAADPSNRSARELLEEVCVESGDVKGAVPFLRHRLRLGPEQARDVLARLKPMIMASPDDETLQLAATEASLQAGDPAAAWGYLADLLEKSKPADPTLLRLVVLCAGATADLYRKVSSHFVSRLPRWAEQPEVIFGLGEAAGRAGELSESVERFRKAVALAPETTEVGNAAIRALAKDTAHKRTGQERAVMAEALLDAGDVVWATESLRGLGALPAASASRLVEKFTAALRADPKNIALSTGLAEICVASGQVGRALEIARAGLAGREDAASAPLTLTYGDALARSGKPAEATRAYAATAKRDPTLAPEVIERLQQIIQVDMGLETAHLALGRLLINEGRVSEGISALLTSWSIKPDLGPMVLKDLERTERRHPGEPSIDFARSQILLETGDPVGAADALSSHIVAESDQLAWILTQLETIATRHPQCGRAQVELGRAYLARRWAARACACFARAHKLDASLAGLIARPLADIQRDFPDEPEANIARGAIYEAEGKLLPAAEAYQKAASLGGIRGAGALEGLRRLCASGRDVPGAVHLARARACRSLGDVNETVDAARRTLAASIELAGDVRGELDLLVTSNPASAVARLGRAAASVKLQDLEGASRDLSEALRLDAACSDSVVALAREILERRPSFSAAARVMADALVTSGDLAGAAKALDMVLAVPESGGDLELLLARRELAVRTGDLSAAAGLLARAENAAVNRDAFLDRLHREVLRAQGARSLEDRPAVASAIARADYARAADILSHEAASPRKAWVLEKCGRLQEAGACLSEILEDPRAAAEYASMLDRLIGQELEGKAPRLVGETTLDFGGMTTIDEIPSRPARAGEAAQGGIR